MLHQDIHVPYYQLLPKNLRNPQGDYPLTPAGNRYWSKMNFPQRPKSTIQTLEQKVTVTENTGGFELAFDVGGHNRVPVTIELTFRRDGELEEIEPAQEDQISTSCARALDVSAWEMTSSHLVPVRPITR